MANTVASIPETKEKQKEKRIDRVSDAMSVAPIAKESVAQKMLHEKELSVWRVERSEYPATKTMLASMPTLLERVSQVKSTKPRKKNSFIAIENAIMLV